MCRHFGGPAHNLAELRSQEICYFALAKVVLMSRAANVINTSDHRPITGNKNILNPRVLTLILAIEGSRGVLNMWARPAPVIVRVASSLSRVAHSADSNYPVLVVILIENSDPEFFICLVESLI